MTQREGERSGRHGPSGREEKSLKTMKKEDEFDDVLKGLVITRTGGKWESLSEIHITCPNDKKKTKGGKKYYVHTRRPVRMGTHT